MRRDAALGALAGALFLLAMWPIWCPPSLSPDVVQRVLFDAAPDGELGLLLVAPAAGFVPTIRIADGTLEIPPGYTVALPSDAPFTVAGPGRAPWFGLGRPSAGRIDAGSTLAPAGLVPWELGAGWAQDRDRLGQLARDCGTELTVRDGTIALGRCTAPVAGELVVLAAGPDWLYVERGEGFGPQIEVLPGRLVASVIASAGAAGLLAWVLGLGAALGSSLAVAAFGLAWPGAGPIGLLLALFLGWGGGVVRSLAQKRAALVGLLLAPIIIAGVLVAFGSRPADRVTPGASCTLTGYSTAEGHSLPVDAARPSERLRAACAPCAGGVRSLARGGQTLAFVRDQICGSGEPLDGHTVVFLGGANDDLMWGMDPTTAVGALSWAAAQLGALTGSLQGADASARFYTSAAAATRARWSSQEAVVREVATCAADRGARLVFVQDLLAPDLEGGRGPDRAWMAARRAELLAAAGAAPLDMAELLGDRAGIGTFSDLVHLSGPGHDALMPALCGAISGGVSGSR